jgi:hypothetical protein
VDDTAAAATSRDPASSWASQIAVGRLVEDRTGWSIRRFVRTARRYRTVQIRAGQQLITAADPVPADLQTALAQIHHPEPGH